MKIKQSDIHRICVAQDAELVNMAYAEVGEDDYEVLGVFGPGFRFSIKMLMGIFRSDDPGEFDTAVDMEVASTIFRDLERYRADFEIHDESGDLVGISEAGLDFLAGLMLMTVTWRPIAKKRRKTSSMTFRTNGI